MRMRRPKLFINFVGRSSLDGLVFGPILGILYYLSIFGIALSILGLLYFALLGAFIGVSLGGFNGLALSITTSIAYWGARDGRRKYRWNMLLVSTLVTIIVSSFLFYSVLSLYAVKQDPASLTPLILLATTIATAATGYQSQILSTWYLKQAH